MAVHGRGAARVATGWCRWEGDALILEVRVQPGASRDEIAGVAGDRLRVRVAAPPVDGRANDRLRRFLAGAFGVAGSRVALLSGQGSRDKRLRLPAPARWPGGIAWPPRADRPAP